MGRRIRHMNPAHHDSIRGGTCLDARFITGVADGAGLQTWNSRTGGSHTYTQATAGNRPIYTLRSQGGAPAVVFTAANSHWMSRSGGVVASTANPYTIITAASGTTVYSQTSNTSFLASLAISQWVLWVKDTVFSIFTGAQRDTTAVTNTSIAAAGRSDATNLFMLSRPNGATGGVTNASLNLATNRNSATANTFSNSTFSAISIATAAISASFRNRVMHHYGFSFKRAL